MMRNTTMLLGLVALGVLTLGSSRSAVACPGCDVDEWCEMGARETRCEVYEHNGQRWHRHALECDDSLGITPMEASPPAPYLAGTLHTRTPADTCRHTG